MADDQDIPNRSGKRRSQDAADHMSSRAESGFEKIERIGRRASMRSAEDLAERQRIERARDTVNGLEAVIESNPGIAIPDVMTRGLDTERQTIRKLGPRIAMRRDTRKERAVEETLGAIERDFSSRSMNGEIGDIAGREDVQQRALGMMGQSPRQLGRAKANISSQISALEKQALSMTENSLYDREGVQDPAVAQEIKAAYRKKSALVQKLGTIEATERQKKSLGEDEASQINALFSAGKKAENTLFKAQVSDELRSGQGLGSKSMDELEKQKIQQARALTDALEKLRNSTGATTEEIDKLKVNAGTAAEDLKKTGEAISQRGAMGSGGGNNGAAAAMRLSTMFGSAGIAAQELMINQPLQALQARSGFAAMSNQMYQNRSKALKGDMTELMLLSSDSYKDAAARGDEAFRDSMKVTSVNAIAGGLSAGAGTAQAINAAKTTGITLGTFGAGELGQGIQQAAQGASQALMAGGELVNQGQAGGTSLAFNQAKQELDRQNVQVRAQWTQSFYNTSMGARQAALAAGGGGRNYGQLMGMATNSAPGGEASILERERISPEEMTRMAAIGGQMQGSQFNTDQIVYAQRLERAGVGDKDSTMQRMGILAGAGSNNPQAALGSVMEAAFSKSLDSAKSLNMMAENTAALVQNSVGATITGMDTSRAAASGLAALINPDIQNKEKAVQQAMSAAQQLNEINSGVGVNFSDMAGVASITGATGKSWYQGTILKGLDDPTAKAIQRGLKDYEGMSPEKQKEFAKQVRGAGLTEFVNEDGEIAAGDRAKLGAGLKSRALAPLMSSAAMFGINQKSAGYAEMIEGKLSWAEIESNKQYKPLADSIIQATRVKGSSLYGLAGSQVVNSIQGAEGITTEGIAKAATAAKGEGASPEMNQATMAATAGNVDLAKQVRLASDGLGGAAAAITKIAASMEALNTQLSKKTAGDFQNAASEAAANFKTSADLFGKGVTHFGEAVEKMKAGIPTRTSDALLNKLDNLVNALSTKTPAGPGAPTRPADNSTKVGSGEHR